MSLNHWYEGNLKVFNSGGVSDPFHPIMPNTPQNVVKIEFFANDSWGLGKWVEFEVFPESVCQFTGLHDINNVRVWENDQVYFYNPDGIHYKGIVKWKKGAFRVVYDDESGEHQIVLLSDVIDKLVDNGTTIVR